MEGIARNKKISVDDDGKKLLKMLEGGDSIDWKKKYDDCMESKVSISKTPKYWVDDAFPEVKGGEKPPITDPLAKVMTERWEKEFPKDEKPPIARQTDYYCPRCGNEISDVENAVNSLYIEVEREDLELGWRIFEMLENHEVKIPYNIILEMTKFVKSLEKYLGDKS